MTRTRTSPALHLDPVFELSLRELPGPARAFLDAWGERHGQPPTLEAYLGEVWPSELPVTFVAASAATKALPTHQLDVVMRPIAVGPHADRFAVGSRSLALRVFRRQAKLVVHRVEQAPHVVPRSFERAFHGVASWQPDRFMRPEDLDQLTALPERRRGTHARLKPWREYLDWRLRRLDEERVVVPVKGAFAGASAGEIVLRLATLDGLKPGLDVVLMRQDGKSTLSLGKICQVDAAKSAVVVRPSNTDRVLAIEDFAEWSLATGQAADRMPLEFQRKGLDRLERDQGHGPEMADFLFDAAAASPSADLADLPGIEGGSKLNSDQRLAVRKALEARDLCLIQGPPGTGKTTVIAEICLRSVLAGKRVLIASQTNLAVDNALARLLDRPEIRALRIAKEERVDEDFKHLLPDRVVEGWLEKVERATKSALDADASRRLTVARRREAVATLGEAAARQSGLERELALARDALAGQRNVLEALRGRCEVTFAALRVWSEARSARLAFVRWLDGHEARFPSVALDADEESALESILGGAPLRVIERARRVAPLLDELERLVESFPRSTEAAISEETREEIETLRKEKSRLAESLDDEESRRLAAVNRRLRSLEVTAHAQLARRVRELAATVFDSEPSSLRQLVEALSWTPTLVGALDGLRQELVDLRAHGLAAERAASELGERFTRRIVALDVERPTLELARADAERERDAADGACRELSFEIERLAREHASANERSRAARDELQSLGLLDGGAHDIHLSHEASEQLRRDVAETLRERELAERAQNDEDDRWRALREGWLQQLEEVTSADREALIASYVRRANVVGVTCHEAGKPKLWSDPSFRPFDVVIVDEVSKATPPELVLPMLLGRKTILVGDHRQLPPMFRERDCTYEGAVEEKLIDPDELESIRSLVTSSLFEELYRGADDSIRHALSTQYRMHPAIMEVVNEVYEGRLRAGGGEESLAAARRHGLDVRDARGGPFIEPDHSLVWIDSSRDLRGDRVFETQVGSSKENAVEVGVVIATLERLSSALLERGYRGRTTHAVRAPTTARDLVTSLVPSDIATELFRERRVRSGGRSLQPSAELERGVEVVVDARKDVGVISFYGAQLRAIRRALGQNGMADDVSLDVRFPALDLRTDTVDRFQGMERSIVVVSLVRATSRPLSAFASDFRRVNVAFSRARELLVVTGARETWSRVPVEVPTESGEVRTTQLYSRAVEIARLRGGFRSAKQLMLPEQSERTTVDTRGSDR